MIINEYFCDFRQLWEHSRFIVFMLLITVPEVWFVVFGKLNARGNKILNKYIRTR